MSDKALIDAVVVMLKAAPAVTAVAGQRVYATRPRLPTYPCVVVTRSEARSAGENDAVDQYANEQRKLTCTDSRPAQHKHNTATTGGRGQPAEQATQAARRRAAARG